MPHDDNEDIPVLDDSMLDSSVEFEGGMVWFPPVTLALIVSFITVFVLEAQTGALTKLERLVEMGALSRPLVEQGELWRLLSSEFLHGSSEHLIGNLLMFYILGLACEHAYGSSRFIFLFVVVAVGGSTLSLLNNKTSVGASGSIFGLAGLLIGLFGRYRSKLHVRDHRIGFVVGIWAVFTIVSAFRNPRIDNLAHVGGFVTGLIFGGSIAPALFFDRIEYRHSPVTILMSAVGSGALILMLIWFIPRLVG